MQQRRRHRVAGRVLLLLIVLVLAAYLAMPSLSRTAAFRNVLQSAVFRATGSSLEIGEIEVAYDLSLTGKGIRLRYEAAEPFLTVEEVRLTPSVGTIAGGPLLRADLEAAHFHLDRLQKPSGEKEQATSPEHGAGARIWLPPLGLRLHDSFVHHRRSTFGPIELALEARGRDALTLTGRSEVATAGNEIGWSLEIDRTPVVARAEMRGKFADLAAVVRSLTGIPVPDGVVAKASDVHATGETTLRPEGGVSGKARFVIDGLDAHDTESSRVLQAAKTEASIEAVMDADGMGSGRLDASTARGEVLWDLFYANLEKYPVRLRLDATIGKVKLRAEKVEVEVANFASASGNGSSRLDGRGPKFDVRVNVPNLAPTFDLAVRQPFKQSYPFLVDTQIAGRATARLSYQSGEPARIAGRLDLEGGRVVTNQPSFRIDGLNLAIPFRIGDSGRGGEEAGLIEAAALELGGVPIDSVKLDLAAASNRVFLSHPVEVPVLGGTFTLADLSVEELGGPEPHARAGFALGNLELRALADAMGWPPFGGSLSGAIPNVTIAADHVQSQGQIEIQVFDGTVRIRNLRLDQLLSPVPELSLDLDFQNLSLKNITRTFDVGRVSGVVSGAFERLVIVRGQPVSFDAWLATVDTRGVGQKVSVKALRQISILGGSGGDAITRGILNLFDEYGYAKMGFRCRLRNDRFEIEGVESRGGKEYLVVGSFLPPKVDVVSHSQVISFSEMMRRLERAIEVGGGSQAGDG